MTRKRPPSGATSDSPADVLKAIQWLSGDQTGCVNGLISSRITTAGVAAPTLTFASVQWPGIPDTNAISSPFADHVGDMVVPLAPVTGTGAPPDKADTNTRDPLAV